MIAFSQLPLLLYLWVLTHHELAHLHFNTAVLGFCFDCPLLPLDYLMAFNQTPTSFEYFRVISVLRQDYVNMNSEVCLTMWARAERPSAPFLNASARRRANERYPKHRLIAVSPCTSNMATVQTIFDSYYNQKHCDKHDGGNNQKHRDKNGKIMAAIIKNIAINTGRLWRQQSKTLR